jgi:hypothetical protein
MHMPHCTNTHFSSAAVYHSTTCFKISARKSHQGQTETDTEIRVLWYSKEQQQLTAARAALAVQQLLLYGPRNSRYYHSQCHFYHFSCSAMARRVWDAVFNLFFRDFLSVFEPDNKQKNRKKTCFVKYSYLYKIRITILALERAAFETLHL